MRKWMSERLKRRKKAGEGSTKEANKALEPLQPRFYDNEPLAPAAANSEVSPVPEAVEPQPAAKAEPYHPDEPLSAAPPSTAAEARPRPSRRRRNRGGRGKPRPRPPIAAPPVIETSEPSAELPVAEPEVAANLPTEIPPAQAAPAPARASKGTVVLAIGLPGSGKSSWFKRHNIHPLSSDLLRELLFDDAQEQRFQDLVFSNLRSMLKARLIARRPMNYVDATNLTPHDRHSWIKLAKDYGYDVQGLFFDVPLEVCMERHQRRGRVVPEEIMRKMAGKLKPPTFDEGFSKITVVRVKQKEAPAG
ncbi:MAG: AAA family ATPase [Terriglobales bacterium]